MNQAVRSHPPGGRRPVPAVGTETIVSGEAVAVDLRVARLGSRVVAALIDLIAQLYLLGSLTTAILLIVRPTDDALVAAMTLLVYVLVLVGYPVTCETLSRGRTLGKMVMGIRVVRDDGGPIHFRHAFARGLVGAVVERPGVLLGLPAIISMLSSRTSKRLGDIFAGTVVLQVSVPRTVGEPPFVPLALLGWVSLLDLSGMDDSLALRARQFLSRAHALSPPALERLGSGLVDEIRSVVTPPPPPGTPGWAYLSAVLAERSRRSYARLVAQRPAGGHPVSPAAPPWTPARLTVAPPTRPQRGQDYSYRR
ncbi:RDD family protein [Frankia sp. AgKG'84/4]|uniref:RDD family protein n=1 Tax=Frankia sp. AgKG'84/4 TaxID=573490 RepID=UPI00200C970F|nr:RDD family protein [Frankia sp. AgKG'84/4]MCL9795475.1 RDD family protein [Frankia sp. AgKG'84/4]